MLLVGYALKTICALCPKHYSTWFYNLYVWHTSLGEVRLSNNFNHSDKIRNNFIRED